MGSSDVSLEKSLPYGRCCSRWYQDQKTVLRQTSRPVSPAEAYGEGGKTSRPADQKTIFDLKTNHKASPTVLDMK